MNHVTKTAQLIALIAGLGLGATGVLADGLKNQAYVGVNLGLGGMQTQELSDEDNVPSSSFQRIEAHHKESIVYKDGIYNKTSSTEVKKTQVVQTQIDTSIGGGVLNVYGGYLFAVNSRFAIGPELGYVTYSNNTYTFGNIEKFTYSGYTLDLLANATYAIDQRAYIFGKIGVAYVTQNLSLNRAVGESTSQTRQVVLPEARLGIGMRFSTHFAAEVSLLGIAGEDKPNVLDANTQTKIAPVGAVMLGIQYRF